MKIDKRRKLYIVFDTETANSFDDPFVYDIGFAVVDKMGRVYEKHSLIIREVFYGMADLMKSAYYAEKIPMYLEQIAKGERKVVSFYEAKKMLADVCREYNIKVAMAHNARFDDKATKTTQRYLTKSKYRYFLPYGVELWDTLKMAHDTICQQKSYKRFCEKHGFMTNHKTPRPQEKAETIYRYMIDDPTFEESHTGLEDVMIEKEIFSRCMRQHKPMRKKLYED